MGEELISYLYMKVHCMPLHSIDPIYRASSNRDHMKDSFKAQTGPDKIVSHVKHSKS